MNKYIKIIGIVIFMSLLSCNNTAEISPEIVKSSIEKNNNIEDKYIPYTESSQLKSCSGEKTIVDLELARKIAMFEVKKSGFVKDLNWNGYRLSKKAVAIFDLNSCPRYYDFIVFNSENNPIGTIKANTKKTNSTIIKGVYPKIFDYNNMLTKSSSQNSTLLIDWKGSSYVGIKSKSGNSPTNVILVNTGKEVQVIKDLEGEEMVMKVLPGLLETSKSTVKMPKSVLTNPIYKNSLKKVENTNVRKVKKDMKKTLAIKEKEAKAYWDKLSEIEKELINSTDEELNNNTKFLGFFKRLFKNTVFIDQKALVERYRPIPREYNIGGFCGPWACGYVLHKSQGINKYDFFYDCASTFGEFSIGNYLLRGFGGRPMTPVEMYWSMLIASDFKIFISPILRIRDKTAFYHLKAKKGPVFRLCAPKGGLKDGLHWTVAYGAKRKGNIFWSNYYFIQCDNGSSYGTTNTSYTEVDWWNPWLLVTD